MAIDPRQAFQEAGAVMDGHFLLTSGRHSPVYWEKFRVLQQPEHTQALCGLIAARFREQRIQLVAGPTLGGMLLAFEVARQLGVRAVYAEKEGAGRAFRRGFTVSPGDRLLIVDDILTTGSSIKDVIKAVEALGGNIIGLGVLVDRSDAGVDLGYPLFSCLRSPAISYAPDDCPLCAKGVPIVRLGGA